MLPRHVQRMIAADGWLAAHPANRGATTERDSPAQRVVVLSASKAARWPASPRAVVISIRGATDTETPLSARYRGVLRLVFEDTCEFADADDDAATITAAQAAEVASFVRAHANADVLLLHCQAGVSRSRSMAAAICDVEKRPYSFTAVNDDVYRAVRAALVKERDASESSGS